MSSTENEVVLEDMTKAELQDHADELEVEYDTSDTKAELIEKITAAQEEDAETDDEEAAEGEEGEVIEGDQAGQAISSFPGSVPSEQFPERRPIEPDVADVDPGDGEGEHLAPLNAESWVVLDGGHEDVPVEYDGKLAAVISAPQVTEVDLDTGESKTFFPPDGLVSVKERSQGVLMTLPLDAFKEIHTHGRPDQFA